MTNVALLGTGAVASAVVGAISPGVLVTRGSLVLIFGLGVTLAAVATGSPVGLYAGSVIAGLGFGPAFSGIVRSLAPLAPPDQRGALLAALYIVLYMSFSLPTILAGVAVGRYGLHPTTYAYGLAAMALAAATTVAVWRQGARTNTR